MSNLPISIDYSNRDYSSILAALTAAIPNYLPAWVSTSPDDFGIVLLELFSYIGDELNYYTDRVGAEAFLSTAQLRASVLNIAYMLDYAPAAPSPATAALSFTLPAGSASFILPAASQFSTGPTSGSTGLIFETPQAYLIPAYTGTAISVDATNAVIVAVQGVTITGEAVGASSGLPGQTFALYNPNVLADTVVVSLNESGTVVVWPQVASLVTAGPYDALCMLSVDANGVTYVNFGDGVNGRIPATGAPITANYRVGGGSAGNVGANTITVDLAGDGVIVAVTNPAAAVGGADIESLDSIRANVPRSLSAGDRCVSVQDYASVALRIPGVGMAQASSAVSTSVILHIHPTGGPYTAASLQTMVTDPVVGLAQLVTNSFGTGYLDTRMMAGTTVTVLAPATDGAVGYVGVNVSVEVHVLATSTAAQVQNDSLNAIGTVFNFALASFGQRVTLSSVYHAIQAVAGVDYCNVIAMYRTDQTTVTAGDIIAGPAEIICATLAPSVVSVSTTGGM